MKTIHAWFLVLVILFVPALASSQPIRQPGILVHALSAAAAGDTSIIEIEAGASNGFFLRGISLNNTGASHAIAILDATVIDLSSAVVTPTATFGSAGMTTTFTVRTGLDSAGVLPGAADYLIMGTRVDQALAGGAPIYIPPGKFLTIRNVAVNTAVEASLVLVEAR